MPYKDPEVRRAYRHAYYETHKDKELADSAVYAAAHREEIRAYVLQWRVSQGEALLLKKRVSSAVYRAENPEKIRILQQEYAKITPTWSTITPHADEHGNAMHLSTISPRRNGEKSN